MDARGGMMGFDRLHEHQPEAPAYRWEIEGDSVKITVSYGPLDVTITGRFSEDGQSFDGSWGPNPGADETVNVAYDIGGHRLS